MNIINKYLSFTLIVILMAVMDGLNFLVPHNTGFFSLTGGGLDLWHISKRVILLIIAIVFLQWGFNWWKNIIGYIAFGLIAYFGQLFFYNYLFKL